MRRCWLPVLCGSLLALCGAALGAGGGTKESPTLLTSWKGEFHDGSGELGTYDNNLEAWWLVTPCEAEKKAGKPCTVLLWFSFFETEARPRPQPAAPLRAATCVTSTR